MTGYKRTIDFISNSKVDRAPYHPILMRFASNYANINYKNFCTQAQYKVETMVKMADDFGCDWTTVLSDPFVEAHDFGLKVEFPENDLPINIGHFINEIEDINKLKVPDWSNCTRMKNRVEEIKLFRKLVGDKYFIVGWVEGMFAEYADLRGLSDSCLDLYDNPDKVRLAFDILLENAKRLIKYQVEAGADCIGIGDAATSQIGAQFFKDFCFDYHKEMVAYTHSLGALVKTHICGNTSDILGFLIESNADIIDIDHMVTNMKEASQSLKSNQVFSGNSDPVGIICDGTKEQIENSVAYCDKITNGRTITSAGCEIPPDTSIENFRIYSNAATTTA